MANGDLGNGPRRGSRDNFDGLRRLGEEIEQPRRSPRQPARPVVDEGASQGRRAPRRRVSARVRRRRIGAVFLVLVLLIVGVFGGSWLYLRYRFGKIPSVNIAAEAAVVSGQPVNFLVIGSDSRAGLTGAMAAQAGSVAMVQGQRSDVVQIWHVDPNAGTIALLSIPRDTMVSMGSLTSTVGRFNRINTAYGEGPNPLVKLIEGNFGIPINHVLQVHFSGFVGATDALGGVWMNFPYPSRDAYSGLSISSPGCQLLTGTQALAVARSRHYQYEANGLWLYDGTSDFGRIQRQGAFLRALIDSAKSKYNPLTINAFLSSIPDGITKDSNLGFNELLGLALRYHSIDPNSLVTQTLPTTSVGYVSPWGDVLFVDQPAAQEMLTNIFGSQLMAPQTPPPNPSLETPQPAKVAVTTTPQAPAKPAMSSDPIATPTTTPPPSFDPTPCVPH